MSEAMRLEGWKAIADHLGRDARTAQRWHHERGMPVYHVPGIRGGGVFAYAGELDGWLAKGSPAKQRCRSVEHRDGVEIPPKLPVLLPTESHAPKRRSRGFAVALVTAVFFLAGVSAFVFRIGSAARRSVPTHAELDGATLSALDAKDNVLWTFRLPDAAADAEAGVLAGVDRALPVDLNADGESELVATINHAEPSGRIVRHAEVYCFGPDGDLLWRYHPKPSLTFDGTEFAGPWRVYSAAIKGPPDRGVWVAFIDRTWWPSFVISLDADGEARLRFVNSGHIAALQPVEFSDRELMLAGGFNNEFMLPSLAAFDVRGPAVTSPQTPGTPFVCDDCPSGRPLTYLLFPRSDVNIALGSPFISVADIEPPDGTGSVDVSVRDPARSTRAVYRLAADLTPQSVAFSDTHWAAHQELSAAGRLDHTPEDCPERHDGVVLRMWQSATGWKDLRVGPTFPPKKRH